MKTFVCILFAVTCWTVATAEESRTVLTLSKVMNELKKLKDLTRMDNDTTLIHSPSVNDLKDCCLASALECFRSKVIYLPVSNKLINLRKIISKELRKTFIVKSVSTCSEADTEKAQCRTCDSHPMVNKRTFVENFHTLLQKIFVRLQ